MRYLSFLGIGRNVKQCAFVMHTAQDLFIAHAFHCEPSSGALCKTVEAACKVKYLSQVKKNIAFNPIVPTSLTTFIYFILFHNFSYAIRNV